MYLNATENHWAADIETDDLNATVIWVMCVRNLATSEENTLVGHDAIKQWIEDHPDAIFVTHNGISFDVPQLNKLLGTSIPVKRIVDTFVLSMLYSPSLHGGHSLEAWGKRISVPKSEFNDYSQYTDEMAMYCQQDVRVTAELFTRLTNRMKAVGFTEVGCKIETLAWGLVQKQRNNGFAFDYPRAAILYAELQQEKERLKGLIYERFPPQLLHVRTYAKSRKADGSPTAAFIRHNEVYPRIEDAGDGTYRAFDWVEFNLASPPQRVAKLIELGWVPKEFTKPSKSFPEGQAKATDSGELTPSLQAFADEADVPEVKLIAQWLGVNGRTSAINNWMEVYNHETGCLHGNLWIAQTLRYRHDKPNTANIPAVRLDKEEQPLLGAGGYWTYEARDLWVTRDVQRRRLVGVDAKGIQLRVLANYLEDEAFSEAILSADPHAANQKRLGLATRALTKTITYATLMGAGDKKIATEAGISLKAAKAAKGTFFEQLPGLPKLIARLKWELKKTGRISLCDGSKVLCSSDHMVIPYLLQGDESRIMKLAWIYVDQMVTAEGLDVLKVGDIHDEFQFDVLTEHVDRFIEICHIAFRKAGEFFKYNIQIECDAKVGLTWSQTH